MSLGARNTTMLVWALVGLPLTMVGLALAAYFMHWARSQAEVPWRQQNYQHVMNAYQQVGYAPPQNGYAEQIMQVCARTGSGESPDAARGLLIGASPQQEKVIVGAIIAHECGN